MRRIVDAFIKSWNPSQGTLSPFASSSSQHSEPSDNHLEHYVNTYSEEQSPSISSMFTSDLFSEGGEKTMTEKTFDIGESATTDTSYTAPTNSTEPDPLSENAMQKADRPKDASDVEGKGTYSTTANTTEDAPSEGDTTEPMEKADTCPHCGQAMPVKKSDDGDADEMEKKLEIEIEEEDDEEEDSVEKADSCKDCGEATKMCKCGTGMQKSFWGGAFSPSI